MQDCIELGKKLERKSITKENIEYKDLFENVEKQKLVAQIYIELLEIRKKLEEENQNKTLDPSTVHTVLRNSFDVH